MRIDPWKIVFWTALPITLLLLSALVAVVITACWVDAWWIVPAAKSLGLSMILPALVLLISGSIAYAG